MTIIKYKFDDPVLELDIYILYVYITLTTNQSTINTEKNE